MVAGSILPVALYKNELYFLFGKENPMENSARGYSDFGGRLEKNETPYQGALREGSEELTGFLGNKNELNKLIKKNGGVFPLTIGTYHVHIFMLDYDENLPVYYNNNHKFLWNTMDKNMLNKSKLFEKIEIHWFSVKEMKSRILEFRAFYREIVDILLENKDDVKNFIKSKKNKTLKKR